MTADEWCSFDKYAPRIKVFQNLCSSVIHGYEDIDVHVFNDLQSVRPDRPLFPSLQILQTPILSDADNTNLVMIPLLLPRLRRVDLFSTPVSSAYYLAHLVMQAPGLSHLRYVGSVGSSPLLSITISTPQLSGHQLSSFLSTFLHSIIHDNVELPVNNAYLDLTAAFTPSIPVV